MATYYIRADGKAINKEFATGPVSNASKCMNIAVHNNEIFNPGDIIYLSDQGGDYDTSITEMIISSSGEKNNEIQYLAVKNEKPVLDSKGLNDSTFIIKNLSHIIIDGLVLKNAVRRMLRLFAKTENAENLIVRNCTFTGSHGGIGIQPYVEYRTLSDVCIENCVFKNLDADGIRCFFGIKNGVGIIYNITIQNCMFDKLINVNAPCWAIRCYFADIVDALEKKRLPCGVVIKDNTIKKSNHGAIHMICKKNIENLISGNVVTSVGHGGNYNTNAFQLNHCENLIVENNEISFTETKGPGDGNGIILDWANRDANYISENVTVRYNLLYENTTGTGAGISAFRCKNSKIHHNVSYRNRKGIRFASDEDGNCTNNVFYNNMICNNLKEGIDIDREFPESFWVNNTTINNNQTNNDSDEMTYIIIKAKKGENQKWLL